MKYLSLFAIMLTVAGCNGSSDSAPNAVFMGDSITYQWTLPAQDLDAGVAGNTTAMMLERFQVDVMAHHPKAVAILGGTNDVRTVQSPTTDDIAAMAQIAAKAGVCVIIGTIPPISDAGWAGTTSLTPQEGDTTLETFNTQLHALAAAYGYHLADYHAALVMPDGTQNGVLFTDGIHPNDAGHAAMWAVVDPLLLACQ